MIVFDRIVMISPVGLEKDRILTGFKKFGITHLYLIQSEEKGNNSEEKRLSDTVRLFATELKNNLIKIYEEHLKVFNANVTDLKDCMRVLKKITDLELKEKATKIYINISTSSKIFAIAAVYLAGFVPNIIIPFYARTSNYLIQEFIEILNNKQLLQNSKECVTELMRIKEKFFQSGWTTGNYEIKIIPALPFKMFTDFQKQIFKELIKRENVCKINDLVKNRKNKNINEKSFRSKLSYALHDLVSYGLVEKKKKGKFAYLSLTEIGDIFGKYLINF